MKRSAILDKIPKPKAAKIKKPKPAVKKAKPEKNVEVQKPKGPSFEDLFAEEAKELKAEEKAKICHHHQKGRCKRGQQCTYKHVVQKAQPC